MNFEVMEARLTASTTPTPATTLPYRHSAEARLEVPVALPEAVAAHRVQVVVKISHDHHS